jgi:hypothetical protein
LCKFIFIYILKLVKIYINLHKPATLFPNGGSRIDQLWSFLTDYLAVYFSHRMSIFGRLFYGWFGCGIFIANSFAFGTSACYSNLNGIDQLYSFFYRLACGVFLAGTPLFSSHFYDQLACSIFIANSSIFVQLTTDFHKS